MKGWMSDAVQNHSNGFSHMNDGSVVGGPMMDAVSAPMGTPNSFPPSQFSTITPQAPHQQQHQGHPQQHTPRMASQQHPQQGQAMPNGSMRNPSPSPFPPTNGGGYSTNSVIPAKRPRPLDDGPTGSPRPNPNLIPSSRSETPPQMGNYVQFPGGTMPGQQQGQYSHLQSVSGSANATPSPTMANQMRPGSVPQRVATASPHAFSPGASQFGGQGSPVPSDQGTPQPGQFSQGLGPGFAPNFNASSSPGAHGNMPQQQMAPQMMQQMMAQPGQAPGAMFPLGMQPGMQPGMQARNMSLDQQKAFQMRAQQQHQQAQMAQQGAGRGMAPKQGMPPNGHVPPSPGQMPPGQMPPGVRPPGPPSRNDSAAFMKHLTTFMNSRGLPFDPNPVLLDQPINIMALFQQAQARGGYKNIMATNTWPGLAAALGFHPNQFPMAPNHLKGVYEQTLLRFEEAVQSQRQQKQQQQQQQQQQQPGMPGQPGQPGQQMVPRPMVPHGPMGQPMAMPPVQPHPQSMPPGAFPGQVKPGQQPPPRGHMNGYPAPHPGAMMQPATPGHPQRRDSMQFATPTGGGPMAVPSPASAQLPPASGPPKLSHHSNFRTETYFPAKVTNRDSYGQVGEFDRTFRDAGLIGAMRPDVPSLRHLGNINVHALARSIQSGIHGEVRMALDTLATVSKCEHSSVYLYISACDDLLEVLMECAEDQLDLLAEHTPEVSDEMQLLPYEDLVRACQVDMFALRRDPPFGSLEHDLNRAVERLLCIMTILRNLSFPPEGVPMQLHMDQMRDAGQAVNGIHPLADESVLKFVCDVVRYIGTRTMFLRTNMDTLDFMKDLVTMLSNIAGYTEIPGREQAMCLLQFLLAFAPAPAPIASNCGPDDGIMFAPYDPALHPYLPAAVDSLAKLLARDDPNRSYYNTIFALEATSPTPYDLLTRTFALAVSPIPDQTRSNMRNHLPTIIDARMPSIMQGLLAADILASLAPGPETGLARAWVTSPSGFAQNLNLLIGQIMVMIETRPRLMARNMPRHEQQELPETLLAIRRALSMQKSLLDKSRDPYDPTGSIPAGVAPPMALALRALDLKPDMWVKEGVLSLLLSCVQMNE